MAAAGLQSYRYRGKYGFIMIGAKDDEDALKEAQRSVLGAVAASHLEIWSGDKYVAVQTPPAEVDSAPVQEEARRPSMR